MASGYEAFIILGVAACSIAVTGGILWLAYLAYIGKFSRTAVPPTRDQSEMLSRLTANWQQRWPGARPVGHELPGNAPDRWVRFHSLPHSKRYADTPPEYATLLDRHHAVLAELIATSADKTLIVMTCSWSKDPRPRKRSAELERAAPQAALWKSIVEDDSDPDDRTWLHLYVSRHHATSELNRLLMLVADDVTAGVIIADEQLTCLYHPYDGGADVIAPSVEMRDALHDKHSSWLSAHPQYL